MKRVLTLAALALLATLSAAAAEEFLSFSLEPSEGWKLGSTNSCYSGTATLTATTHVKVDETKRMLRVINNIKKNDVLVAQEYLVRAGPFVALHEMRALVKGVVVHVEWAHADEVLRGLIDMSFQELMACAKSQVDI